MTHSLAKAPDDELQPPDQSTTNKRDAPPLSGWERLGATVVGLGGGAVGALGFYASFDSVSAKAAEWGFTDPHILPIAIDSAIPVFTGAYLLLIRMGMPLAWVRFVPWVLSLITCALNVAAGDTLWSKVAHGSMSLLWVGVSEIAAHIYAVRIGAATGRRRQMDSVRLTRWALSPLPTFLLWRRMKLWEISDYDEALKLEQERLVYQAALRSKFGRGWRRKAPVPALLPLQLVGAGVPLAKTAADGLRAAGIEPTGIFAAQIETVEVEAIEAPAPATAPALPPAAVPTPAAVAPAAVPKPRTVTATVPPQPPQSQYVVPPYSTEGELYLIIQDALNNGHRELFDSTGPLTGGEIGNALGQSEGNGRKVRTRLIKTYAAKRGIALPAKVTVDAAFEAFGHRTPVSP
ncbi:DUF2637 domain-containing protein [Streptomyces sp. NPDC051362]|uniref:DUF2637 domain-containing protein n=1 Tax=Streptomyces sp. NPDC051362 TaxID=3365651 RepID=UPI0037896BCD